MLSLALAALLSQAAATPTPAVPPKAPAAVNPGAGVPSAAELIAKLDKSAEVKTKDKPFEICASLGRLYMSNGRMPDAVSYLEQAVAKAQGAREFYVQQRAKAGKAELPTPEAAGCPVGAEPNLEQQLAKAKALSGQPLKATACARAALLPLIDVENQLADAKFLTGEKEQALAISTRALELFDSNAQARYARAALTLDTQGDDVKALARAKADLERYLKDVPNGPKSKQARAFLKRAEGAIAAGGMTKLAALPPVKAEGAPSRPPMLTQEQMNGFNNVERTPELQASLLQKTEAAEEHLAKGRYQEALDTYKQVMPLDPNPRVRAGMAWTMVKLNRQPMAERIWSVAAGSPEAIDALGDSLKAKGDAEGAKALWTKLAETVPAYAPVKGKLDGSVTAPPSRPPMLSPEQVNAFNAVERTPELQAGLVQKTQAAEEHLAKGRYQEALDTYKQVMPLDPNPRVRAGMAWSLVRLNKQPMADRIWEVAAQSPEAIDALGDALKAQGDGEGAKALWGKLAQTVPAYAAKIAGKLK